MGFYNVINPTLLQTNQPEDISQVLANFNAIAAVLNGALDNSNIAAGAGIDPSKVNLPTDMLNAIVPIGTILAYGGDVDPPGGKFIIIDGRSLLRATYTQLFNLIGTRWGSVDGTHFNIPDGTGRTIFGVDGVANRLTLNDLLGNAGGAEKVGLTDPAMLPSHDHGGATVGNSAPVSGSVGGSDGLHGHAMASGSSVFTTGPTFFANIANGAGTNFVMRTDTIGSGGSGHGHGFSLTANNHAHGINAQGSATPHDNMPPFFIANWIMRVL